MEFRQALLGISFFGFYFLVSVIGHVMQFSDQFLAKILVAFILTFIMAFVTKRG